MGIIEQEESDIKNIFNRFRKRDFSGTMGQAMKNSSYQLTQNLIFKFGSLLFTIVLARMLLPEKMGLYNLALSTIILFASFSDLGIGSALITFGAKMLGKGDLAKAKGYAKKLFRWKLYLIFISTAALLISAYFIAEIYYAKPIFFALLVGGIYLPVISILEFVEQLFRTTEDFRTPMIKEIIFQISRFTLVPISILLFIGRGTSNRGMIVTTLMAIVAAYLIALLFLVSSAKRRLKFLPITAKKLTMPEIRELKKFIFPLSATAFAGMFFGYVDTLMLGHFVSSSFIAYYGAAFTLVGGIGAVISFMAVSLLPIFAKSSGKTLENIFRKSRNLTALISIFTGVFTYFAAWWAIRIVYGESYLLAVPILRYFSVIIVLTPIVVLYNSYFVTQKRTSELAWLILGASVLNITLNYFGITYGLNNYGEMGAVFGAVIATIISRIAYLIGLLIMKNKKV